MKNSKRILVGKAQRKGARQDISSDEIANAIRHFKSRGGLIRELPPQRDGLRRVVGGHLASAFETVIER